MTAISYENRNLKLFACIFGILGFFLIYGITQEKIMTTKYNGEQFKDTALLVLINRIVSIIFSLAMIISQGASLESSAPFYLYTFVAFSNFLSTFCQYEALKYVTFPTQTLGKCGKMIPVLLIGSLFQRKSYSVREYIVAITVTIGCTLFLTTGQISAKKGAETDSPFGLILILFYLAFDGMTSTTQERLFKNYKMSTNIQMLHVNLNSSLISLFVLLFPWNTFSSSLPESRLFNSLDFMFEHPAMLFDALVLSLCSSLGQLIIYYTIKEFGALIYSTIMTTRQFFSIFLSALLFGHPISQSQWIGSFLVFGSLYWNTFQKNSKRKSTLPTTISPPSK